MKSAFISVAISLLAVPTYGVDFVKENQDCFKVDSIAFDGPSAVFKGLNTKGQSVSYPSVYDASMSEFQYKQHVEAAKFVMANNFYLCIDKLSRQFSIERGRPSTNKL